MLSYGNAGDTIDFFFFFLKLSGTVLYYAFNNSVLFSSHRPTTRPARANMQPLELALLVESHCSSLTTLIKHGDSPFSFPPPSHYYYINYGKCL